MCCYCDVINECPLMRCLRAPHQCLSWEAHVWWPLELEFLRPRVPTQVNTPAPTPWPGPESSDARDHWDELWRIIKSPPITASAPSQTDASRHHLFAPAVDLVSDVRGNYSQTLFVQKRSFPSDLRTHAQGTEPVKVAFYRIYSTSWLFALIW